VAGGKDGVSYPVEGTNRYLRLASSKPDEMVMIYRQVRIPATVKAVEMSWKQRTSELKKGKQPWFDARIMLQWKDAAGEKVAGSPAAPSTNKNSDGWVEKQIKFMVPEGAVILEMMPTLFRVTTGTFELDDIVLKETDPAPVKAEAKAREDALAEKVKKNAEKRQAAAAANAGPEGELIANGDFQTDGKGGFPDKWGALKDDLSWQQESDNRFLRLASPAPGKMVLLYRTVDLPRTPKRWSSSGRSESLISNAAKKITMTRGSCLSGLMPPDTRSRSTLAGGGVKKHGWLGRKEQEFSGARRCPDAGADADAVPGGVGHV